ECKSGANSDWTVLEAFSLSHGKSSSYLPIVEMLHGYFGVTSADLPAVRRERIARRISDLDPKLEGAFPYLCALLESEDDKQQLAGMDPQLRRSRTLDAVVRVLLSEARHHPLLLIVEDLHWLDPESQAVLDLLVESIGDA